MKLDNRIWIIVTVLIVGVLFAGGWFLGVQPQLNDAAAADVQRASAVTRNDQLQAQLAALEKAKATLPDLEARTAELDASIPTETDSSGFITALNALAAKSGVVITSITISDGQPYAPPASANVAPAAAPGTTPTPAPSAPAAPAAPKGAPSPVTDGLVTATNFVVVPIQIQVTGSWANSLAFVSGLQHGDRLVLVTGLDSTQQTGGYLTKIKGSIYVLRDPSRPAPVTDDTESSTDPTPSPTDTASPTDTPAPSDTPLPSTTPAPSTTPKP